MVPEVVSATARLTAPDDPPPERPVPAVTPVISPSLPVEEMVIVEPDVEILVAPEPFTVISPVDPFSVSTPLFVILGVCPVPIRMPDPEATPYRRFEANTDPSPASISAPPVTIPPTA